MTFAAKIIELPKIPDDRGNLTFIEFLLYSPKNLNTIHDRIK
jgi:hypothetical protein